MEIIEHSQQGSLPNKMVNWPKNIEAAKALADKYEEQAEAGGVDDVDKLHRITGFGNTHTCTLCAVVIENYVTDCTRCLHFDDIRYGYPCIKGESEHTYVAIEQEPNPENLRARASYLRSVINKFE